MDITFVSAVASASDMSLLSAVQILRINIIMDTFAALSPWPRILSLLLWMGTILSNAPCWLLWVLVCIFSTNLSFFSSVWQQDGDLPGCSTPRSDLYVTRNSLVLWIATATAYMAIEVRRQFIQCSVDNSIVQEVSRHQGSQLSYYIMWDIYRDVL